MLHLHRHVGSASDSLTKQQASPASHFEQSVMTCMTRCDWGPQQGNTLQQSCKAHPTAGGAWLQQIFVVLHCLDHANVVGQSKQRHWAMC